MCVHVHGKVKWPLYVYLNHENELLKCPHIFTLDNHGMVLLGWAKSLI